MYSESDLDTAVAAGAITPEAAAALRDHVAAQRAAPAVDEEQFRLLTGFNDVFVSIALVLLLGALAQLGGMVTSAVASALVAATAWALAEFFTRRRRMALPSILLLVAFVGAVASAPMGIAAAFAVFPPARIAALIGAASGLAGLAAAWLHWRRFGVPITVAAGMLALVGFAVALLLAAWPGAGDYTWAALLGAGLGVFAVAMRWDLSDRERRTRRADVAFWLHLAAAPLIAHSAFQLLGVFRGEIGLSTALVVLALYLAFALVALAVDRRALLVSGLAYVLYALFTLFRGAGPVELSWSLTALVIGSALLTLSAFWQPMRRAVVTRLGDWQRRLPPVAAIPRPA